MLQATQNNRSVALQSELCHGTLAMMHTLYGTNCSQERDLRAYLERIRQKTPPSDTRVIASSINAIAGVLTAMRAEIDAGLIGSLRASMIGQVLTDFIKLSRAALDESDEGADNVAAVLAAAAFEDTMRQLADLRGVPPAEKLADLLSNLKAATLLKGAQVGIAQSYLSFRNKALHAQWQQLDRTSTLSVLAFTEQILLQEFS